MAYKGSARDAHGEVPGVYLPRVTLLTALTLAMGILQMADVATAASWFKILNNLGRGQELRVACYSSDPGHRAPEIIGFGQVFYWKFHAAKFSTRYWCDFEWKNNFKHQSFVVWDHTPYTEMPVSCGQCFWEAGDGGWWAWDEHINTFKFYVRWKDPAKLGEFLNATKDSSPKNPFQLHEGHDANLTRV